MELAQGNTYKKLEKPKWIMKNGNAGDNSVKIYLDVTNISSGVKSKKISITDSIKKVTWYLHKSCKPPVVEMIRPPFELNKVLWG